MPNPFRNALDSNGYRANVWAILGRCGRSYTCRRQMPEPGQPESLPSTGDRRRSRRYGCSGPVQIMGLPWQGALLWGKLSNLGLGGCYIETISPLGWGAQAEIVLRVNDWSMRAIGQVRAVHDHSGIGMEFVRMSTRAHRTLAELMEEMERFRAAMRSRPIGREERLMTSLCLPAPSKSIPVVGVVVPALPGETAAAMQRRLRLWDWLWRDPRLDIFA